MVVITYNRKEQLNISNKLRLDFLIMEQQPQFSYLYYFFNFRPSRNASPTRSATL